MKKIALVLFFSALFTTACKTPYHVGLFVKNSSHRTHIFKISRADIHTQIRETKPGKEWHYTSNWCGRHTVTVVSYNNHHVTVDIPHNSEKKAIVVEWNGVSFNIFFR